MDCATTGAKQVRHRGFDKGICAVACAKKGSSSKHLTFGSFCQEKEQSPAGKATVTEAPKFELFASISGGMFFIAPQLFRLIPHQPLN